MPGAFAGCAVQALGAGREFLLVAIRAPDGRWRFNPTPAEPVEAGCTLVAIVTPGGRARVEAALAAPRPVVA